MSRLTCCMSPVAARAGRPSSAGVLQGRPPRAESCRDLILHPKFAHLAEAPPEVFCPMDWLPDEVISNVLVHLDGRDVARFSAVNRRSQRLCADADVWRELCARRFALEPACSRHHPPPPEGWKALFVLHHEALFRLFRGESERDRMRGGVGAGLEGIGKGRLGGVRIRLGA